MDFRYMPEGAASPTLTSDGWHTCCSESDSADGSVLVSIHDVSPRFEREVDQLIALLSQWVPESSIALLVVPDYWGEAPIVRGTPFAHKVRRWAEQGNEIFLHGWSHRDTTRHEGLGQKFRANFMTAREGEFLGLEKDQALSLLRRGRGLIEDITGHSPCGFVAPGWLYSRGTMEALREEEFALAEDHVRVWEPTSDRVLACGPVITWASRSRTRQLSSIAFATAARWFLNDLRRVRIAVHPGDVRVPGLCHSIEHTLGHFVGQRRIGGYADLLD